jgi:hypothetical protein
MSRWLDRVCRRGDEYIAEIDTDVQCDAASRPDIGVPLGHRQMHRAASTTLTNCTSRPSPVVLTMRPWCSAIFGVEELMAQRFDGLERAFLVRSHQPRIPRHIGGKIAARRRSMRCHSPGIHRGSPSFQQAWLPRQTTSAAEDRATRQRV